MKIRNVFVLWQFCVAVACGQGVVEFRNDSGTLSSPPDRLIRFFSVWEPNPFGTNNAPAVGTNLQVQLYYGASTAAESALIPITAAPARLRASTTITPGVWTAGGTRTLSNVEHPATVMLQIRVWDIYYGATYEEALANGGLTGKSSLFLYTIPPDFSPASAFAMQNFTGFMIGTLDPPRWSPTIYAGPQSQTVGIGQNVTFNVMATGTAPLSYLWIFNGSYLQVNSSVLALTNVQAAQSGNYSARVWNNYGSTTSDAATLTVILPSLTIRQSSPNRMEVAWRTNLAAYTLESASDLSSGWAKATNPISVQGSDFVASENTLAQRYFRLRKP